MNPGNHLGPVNAEALCLARCLAPEHSSTLLNDALSSGTYQVGLTSPLQEAHRAFSAHLIDAATIRMGRGGSLWLKPGG